MHRIGHHIEQSHCHATTTQPQHEAHEAHFIAVLNTIRDAIIMFVYTQRLQPLSYPSFSYFHVDDYHRILRFHVDDYHYKVLPSAVASVHSILFFTYHHWTSTG